MKTLCKSFRNKMITLPYPFYNIRNLLFEYKIIHIPKMLLNDYIILATLKMNIYAPVIFQSLSGLI